MAETAEEQPAGMWLLSTQLVWLLKRPLQRPVAVIVSDMG